MKNYWKKREKEVLAEKFRRKSHPKHMRPDPNGDTWVKREPMVAFDWAHAEYLKGAKVPEISEKTGIEQSQLKNWIAGQGGAQGWKEEREILAQKARISVNRLEKDRYATILDATLTAVERGVTKLNADETREFSVKEIQGLCSVASELHRMSQLELGKPTEINARIKLTAADVMKKLRAADPLIDYSEVDRIAEEVREKEDLH